jgi:hypothetical protein
MRLELELQLKREEMQAKKELLLIQIAADKAEKEAAREAKYNHLKELELIKNKQVSKVSTINIITEYISIDEKNGYIQLFDHIVYCLEYEQLFSRQESLAIFNNCHRLTDLNVGIFKHTLNNPKIMAQCIFYIGNQFYVKDQSKLVPVDFGEQLFPFLKSLLLKCYNIIYKEVPELSWSPMSPIEAMQYHRNNCTNSY